MFNVTRPQSTLFLVIIAVMAFLLLMAPALSAAGADEAAPREELGINLLAALAGGQKTPRALAGLQPTPTDWYARADQATRRSETNTAEADMFFDIDREITVDTDLLKGSAGIQINW